MNTSTSEAGGCHCAGIALCSSRTRATRNTVCQLREDCYLPPVNGPLDGILSCSPISSSFSWFLTYSAIRLLFSLPYPHNTLYTKIPGSCTCISTRRTAHISHYTESCPGAILGGFFAWIDRKTSYKKSRSISEKSGRDMRWNQSMARGRSCGCGWDERSM